LIAGVVASDDLHADEIIHRLSQSVPDAALAHAVANGVAVARWSHGSFVEGSTLDEDHAFVGNLRGNPADIRCELRGNFAAVGRRGARLLLARGRFGGRPLYWCRVGSAMVACSRLLPLATLLRGHLRLNIDHIRARFDGRAAAWLHPLPFEGVRAVLPNTTVEIGASGVEHVDHPPVRLGPELRLSQRDLARRLREELQAAVERQCGGARKVAVLAGGGVDSGALLAFTVLNQRARGGPTVIPVALDHGGDGDDRPHLRALCAQLGIEPLRVAVAEGARSAGQARIIDAQIHVGAPFAMASAAIGRARDAGAEVVISGEGAEIGLDSDPDVFAEFLFQHPVAAVARLMRFRGVCETRAASVRRLALGPLARQVVPPSLLDARQRLRSARNRGPIWARPRLRTWLAQQPWLEARPPPFRGQRERIERMAGSTLVMTTVDIMLRWEMLTSVRCALPYFDDDFLQFVGRIPNAAIFAGARERGLLRESMAGIVPDTLRYRTDKARPYQALAEMFEVTGGYDSVRDLVTMRELDGLALVEPVAFRRDFERFAANPAAADPKVWGTLWGAIIGEAYLRWFRDFNSTSAAEGQRWTVAS
jgi:asparagine synthase (glutamine-hydrolysing)